MARPTKITPEIIDAIAKLAGVGVYPYVAAQTVGVPKTTFYRWMHRAQEKGGKCPKLYKVLWVKVTEAHNKARANAELRVFKDRPYEWLRTGPGRDGWTEATASTNIGVNVDVNTREADDSRGMVLEMPDDHVAQVLCHLEELGLLQSTERGKLLFHPPSDGEDELDALGGNGQGEFLTEEKR